MKGVALFLCLFSYSFAGPVTPVRKYAAIERDERRIKYLLVERNNQIEVEDLVNAPIQATAERDDVFFVLYDKNNRTGLRLANCDDVGSVTTDIFNPKRKTVVIAHGWTSNYESLVNTLITDALLTAYDVNVIVTDWSAIGDRNYITAKNNIVDVGNLVANLITNLVNTNGLAIPDVILVGHSLGAHVCGSAGAALGGQVGKIYGLDPAGPLFSLDNIDERLDPGDAKKVEIIHTTILLGFTSSIGHVDYFPNNGRSQPGCGLDLSGVCSHSRSYEYFAESMLNNMFVSKLCFDYNSYSKGLCNGNPISLMGGFENVNKDNGDYYLNTNSESPFGMGS